MLKEEENEIADKEQTQNEVCGVAEGHENCTVTSCSVNGLNPPLLSSIKKAQ